MSVCGSSTARHVRRGVVGLALLATVACTGRPHADRKDGAPVTSRKSGPAVAVVDVSLGVPEEEKQSLFSLPSRHRTFDELLRALDRMGKNRDVKGILVRWGGVQMGMARAHELGGELEKAKAKWPVYCHADGLTNATYFAATRGCTKIWISPAGEVETIGLAAQVVYLHKLLAEELKLSVDFLQVGKFKGAEEPLTRDGPSPEARESLEAVLRDLRGSWLDGIRAGKRAHTSVEDGPHAPMRAKERGLVEEVGYADEAALALKKAVSAQREEVVFGPGSSSERPDDLGDLVRVLSGEGSTSGPVALVRASGSISMSGGGGIFGGGGGITEKEYGRLFAKLEKDDDVKAVVLRIDSPGGSALASDLMWHQLMKIRARKPIVVSVGDMAASGGYYLASTANVIFAEPTSIVGSIGVVGGKIGFGPSLERFGVHCETFPASPEPGAANRAAYLSAFTSWDDATRARVLESMTGVYDLFLARVAEGRKTTPDKIAPHAEGRIFSGREGKTRGLVDELGGLGDAIARARVLAKLPAEAEVVAVQRRPSFLSGLDPGDDASSEDRAHAARTAEEVAATRLAAGATEAFSRRVAKAVPDVVSYVDSLTPLLDGERALVVLPFALAVR